MHDTLWALTAELCHDLDRSAFTVALTQWLAENNTLGAGKFELVRHYPDAVFPLWAKCDQVQFYWATLEEAIDKMRQLLEHKKRLLQLSASRPRHKRRPRMASRRRASRKWW